MGKMMLIIGLALSVAEGLAGCGQIETKETPCSPTLGYSPTEWAWKGKLAEKINPSFFQPGFKCIY